MSGEQEGRWNLRRTPLNDLSERFDLRRNYNFTVQPRVIRNTFVSSTITIKPPVLRFQKANSDEDNKVCEFALEEMHADFLGWGGPGQTVDLDFAGSMTCQIGREVPNPSVVGTGSFVGIEYNTLAQVPPFPNPPTAPGNDSVAQLRCYLDDPTRFSLYVAVLGSGTFNYPFTVPAAYGDPSWRNRIALIMDPWAHTITAAVDGKVRAQHTGSYVVVAGNDLSTWGLIVATGTMTAASNPFVWWAAPNIVSYNTHEIGSGIV